MKTKETLGIKVIKNNKRYLMPLKLMGIVSSSMVIMEIIEHLMKWFAF